MKPASLLLFLVATAAVTACQDSPAAPDYGPATGNAASFGLWSPGANDDCTKAQHDAYSVVGPDHKLYPTWHPPIDPVTGCSFGHDHGRDPRGSALYRDAGPVRAELRRHDRRRRTGDAPELARWRRRPNHPRSQLRGS